MSDLISTPSQTQSTVSNEAFEALIDLLASDGIDENPSRLPENAAHAQPNVTLRDSSGKLDFDKIHLMFAAQNGARRVTAAQGPLGKERGRIQSSPVLQEDGDTDDEHRSHQNSTVPSRSNSSSPKPVNRAPAGHRRSSTFGNQPWAGIHENTAKAKVEGLTPVLSNQPLAFNELNAALAGAQAEVRSLHRQYDELQALVSKRLGTDIRDRVQLCPSAVTTEKVSSVKQNGHAETRAAGSQAQRNADVTPASLSSKDLPIEIANLTEDEAKRALGTLVFSLNLSLSAIGLTTGLPPTAAPTSPQTHFFPPNPARQHDLASIARALKFLGTVDELVWRRSSASSGPRTLQPVHSEENTIALLARLELWERAVRRSPRV